MEACIEYGNLRNAGHDFLTCLDTRKVCGIMKRSEVETLLDSLLNLIVHENRAAELFTAVKNTVTYSVNLINRADNAVLSVNKSVKNDFESCGMILAADAGEDEVKVIFVDGIPAGSKVR